MEYFGLEQHISDMKEIVQNQNNPIQIIAKFQGLCEGELDDAIKTATKVCYADRPFHKDYLYEVHDLSVCPSIEKMPEELGFVKGYYHAQIQLQRPGCIMPKHTDPPGIFYMIPEDLQHRGVRVLIMLAPWEYGQIMGFNNDVWREWEAGDVLYCDFLNTFHFTANCSSHSRPILQISGLANDKLIESIKNKQTRIINI